MKNSEILSESQEIAERRTVYKKARIDEFLDTLGQIETTVEKLETPNQGLGGAYSHCLAYSSKYVGNRGCTYEYVRLRVVGSENINDGLSVFVSTATHYSGNPNNPHKIIWEEEDLMTPDEVAKVADEDLKRASVLNMDSFNTYRIAEDLMGGENQGAIDKGLGELVNFIATANTLDVSLIEGQKIYQGNIKDTMTLRKLQQISGYVNNPGEYFDVLKWDDRRFNLLISKLEQGDAIGEAVNSLAGLSNRELVLLTWFNLARNSVESLLDRSKKKRGG